MCEHDEPTADVDDIQTASDAADGYVAEEDPGHEPDGIRFGSSSYGTDEWGKDVYWSNSEQRYYKEDDWDTVDPWDKDVKWS